MRSSDVNIEQFVSSLLSLWHGGQLANPHLNVNCQVSVLTKAIFWCASRETTCPSALPGHLKQDCSWKEQLWHIQGRKDKSSETGVWGVFLVFFLGLQRVHKMATDERAGYCFHTQGRDLFITQSKLVQQGYLILLLLFLLLFARFSVNAQTIVSLEKKVDLSQTGTVNKYFPDAFSY